MKRPGLIMISVLVILASIVLPSCAESPDPDDNLLNGGNNTRSGSPLLPSNILLNNCNYYSNGFNNPPENLPYAQIHIDTGYTQLPDINGQDVREIKIGKRATGIYEIPLSGKFLSCTAEHDTDKNTYKPRVMQYDSKGEKLWEKDFTSISKSPIESLVLYPDGQFIISLGTIIVKCDNQGNVVWACDLEYPIARDLVLVDDGSVVALGEWAQDETIRLKQKNTPMGAYIDGYTDIVLTCIDKNGKVTAQRDYGGSDFDQLRGVQYDKEQGIILSGYTQSQDGDFPQKKRVANFIASIAPGSLQINWVYMPGADDDILDPTLFTVDDNAVYVIVNNAELGYGLKGTDRTTYWVKIDDKGREQWRTKLFVNNHPITLTMLDRGEVLIAAQNLMLYVDREGKIISQMEGAEYNATRIWPSGDGGFVAMNVRNIKTVPQPAYISAIWFDTETVVTKFSTDFTIRWRKTYDQYKDRIGTDDVFPLSNGALIVE